LKNKYNNWTKTFFTGIWNEVQIKAYSPLMTKEQTKLIIDILKPTKKSTILDVPCGNGRISEELAKKGFAVTGIDSNKYMLNHAESNKKSVISNIRYFLKDMRDIDFRSEFSYAICFWGSFGYFDDAGNNEFLVKIHNALRAGGKFLMDTHTVETLLTRFQAVGWSQVEDIYVLQQRTYEEISSRIISDWTFLKKGKIEKRTSSMRLYTFKELTDILRMIGFKKITAYGSLKQDLFKRSSERLYLLAEK
jgi:SAM-dependent methyltransferase